MGATFTFKMEYVESADGPLTNVKLIDKDATTEPPYKAFETLETTVTVADGDTSATGVFEEIYFTAAGTYTFKVTETATSDDVHYKTLDDAEWTYTVVVTYNNATGELSAEGTYTKDGVTTPVASATFENPYTPVPVEDAPEATKVITGEVIAEDKTFKFEITADSSNPEGGATLPANTTVNVTVEAGETTADAVAFGNIKFEKAGTYKFTIKEVIPDDYDSTVWTYDDTEWTWTVEIKDNAGSLEVVSAKYAPDGTAPAATFENNYKPKPVEDAPKATKELTGEPIVEAKTFTFEIAADSTNPEGATLPATKTIDVTVPAGSTTVEAVAFGNIKFEKAGEYKFTIKEVIPDGYDPDAEDNVWTYDQNEWTWTVVIKDADEKLEVESAVYAPEADAAYATFTNTYTPKPTEYAPKATKKLTGLPIVSDKTFKFEIAASADNHEGATLPDNKTITVTVLAGETTAEPVAFDSIKFTKAGTYQFTIKEVLPDGYDPDDPENVWIYDDTVWTLTVVVKDVDEKLEVQSAKFDRDADAVYATFTNTYNSKPTVYQPKATKKLTGEKTVAAKTFTFELAADPNNKAGATLPANKTVTVEVPAGAETVDPGVFDAISFSEAGTYYFTIKEVIPDGYDPNAEDNVWTYDTEVWTLEVVIEDADEKLVVKSAKFDKDADAAYATFENNYKPKPVEDAPKATKKLTGEPTVEAKTFTFEITADSTNPEGATLPATTTIDVTVPAGATTVEAVAFDNIKFEKAGTYKFTIKEVIPAGYDPTATDNVWTYDQDEWTWTVVIKDADEKLEVESAVYAPEADAAYATFENNYKPTPVEDAPKATKKLTGEPTVEAKTFTFEITADPNNKEGGASFTGATTIDVTVPAGATTVAAVAFDNIKFEKAGTYKFTIKEVKPDGVNEEVWTYDQHEWTWTVVIKDADEKLVVESATYDPDEPQATFINNYIPLPTEYTPLVEKLTEGPTYVQDVTFDFTLEFVSATNDQGQDVSDGVSPTTGSVSITVKAGDSTGGDPTPFDTLKFARAGVYVFEIKETIVVGSKTIVYDETVWTLTVTVTDKDEYLEASAEYTAPGKNTSTEKATFTNKFLTGDLIVKKSVKGEEADKDKMFTFTVYLYDAEGNPLQGNYEIYIRYKNKETYAGDVENGTAVFKLKHDMTAIIVGIPIDATWKVVEEKYIHYYPGKTNDTGTIQADGNESVWINKWTDNPPGTGDNTNLILWGSLLGVSGIGIALLVVFAKKRKKEENTSVQS